MSHKEKDQLINAACSEAHVALINIVMNGGVVWLIKRGFRIGYRI
jgi:hypothetical protein